MAYAIIQGSSMNLEKDSQASSKIKESINLSIPVVLQGPFGTGKTHLVQLLAMEYTATLTILNVVGESGDMKLLLGTFVVGPNSSFIWKRGLLTFAVEEGHWLVLKDVTRESSSELIAILSTLLENRSLVIPSRSKKITAHPSFRLFITQSDERIMYPGIVTTISVSPRTQTETISILTNILLEKINTNTIDFCVQIAEFIYAASVLNISLQERKPAIGDLIKAINRISSFISLMSITKKQGIDISIRRKISELSIDLFALSIPNIEQRLCAKIAISRLLGLPDEEERMSLANSLTDLRLVNDGFAMTKQTTTLLNILSRGIENNEPMLLVGPTGTGKTTIIQHLSLLKKPKGGLLVVNLHAQTESSDLFGTWAQSRSPQETLKEFEYLFEATGHDKTTNSCLLSKLSKWASSASDPKAMSSFWAQINATATLIRSKYEKECLVHPSNDKKEYFTYQSKDIIERLNNLISTASLSHASGSFLFTFQEGIILKALQTGAWLLLDEVNLAPSSLLLVLESLVAGKPVRVLERGDENPICCDPSFRLFACMNGMLTESTRKSLPESLRMRFTEISVDPIETHSEDLYQLVMARCSSSGLLQANFADCYTGFDPIILLVSLYYSIKKEIKDGMIYGPEIPSWTIRSLCRLIDIWVQFISSPQLLHPRMALKQSIMVVIGVQLNESCCKFLFRHFLPSMNRFFLNSFSEDEKKNPLPTNNGQNSGCKQNRNKRDRSLDSIQEAYCIPVQPLNDNDNDLEGEEALLVPKGPLKTSNSSLSKTFIETAYSRRTLFNVTRVLAAGHRNPFGLMLVGPTSAGKTSVLTELARRTGHSLIRINNHEHTDVSEYLGSWTFQSSRIVFRYGALVRALTTGAWVLLDELNLAPTEVLESLNRLLDDNRQLYIPETGQTITPHPAFRLFATLNPSGRGYGGRHTLSEAFKSRWVIMQVDEDPAVEEIIRGRCSDVGCWLAPSASSRMASFYSELRRRGQFRDGGGHITLRDMFRWAARIQYLDQRSGLSHLLIAAQAGWSLLGERLRNAQERSLLRHMLEDFFSIASPIQEKHLKTLQFQNQVNSACPTSLDSMGPKPFICENDDTDFTNTSPSGSLSDYKDPPSSLNEQEENFSTSSIIHRFKISANSSVSIEDDHWIYPDYSTWEGIPPLGTISSDIIWTKHTQRMAALIIGAISASKDSVLIVGETGTGKTSIVHWLASNFFQRQIQTIACHQYTDVADFLGMQRPITQVSSGCLDNGTDDLLLYHEAKLPDPLFRHENELKDRSQGCSDNDHGHIGTNNLESTRPSKRTRNENEWIWVDGPLIQAMKYGHILLIDEISLAEDSVLERLNSVLESDTRTLTIVEHGSGEPLVIHAHPSFAIIATMNPSGDFGKKELSPALRNRFTEIWVPSTTNSQDMLQLLRGLTDEPHLPEFILAFVSWFIYALNCTNWNHITSMEINDDSYLISLFKGLSSPVFTISFRDLKTWIDFIKTTIYSDHHPLSLTEAYCQGAEMVFLDGLTMLTNGGSGSVPSIAISPEHLHIFKRFARDVLNRQSSTFATIVTSLSDDKSNINPLTGYWGIDPFYLPISVNKTRISFQTKNEFYHLDTPTVRENALRVLRSMQLPHRPLLLEGDPGVGKTSLICAIAKITNNEPVVRINLSEQTDLSDLFGVDMPSGTLFTWNDGPLLAAVKAGYWILLDEINLASQQVLEGLNSVLDHRGTLYVSALNRSWKIDHKEVRIFATQNPKSQGGGRKGLPRSFLNRFTRVYLELLTERDLIEIIQRKNYLKHTNEPDCKILPEQSIESSLPAQAIEKIVSIANTLNKTCMPHFDFNLRDILRLLELNISNEILMEQAVEMVFGSRFEIRSKILDNFFMTLNPSSSSILSVRKDLGLSIISRWPYQKVIDALEIGIQHRWLCILKTTEQRAFPIILPKLIRHLAEKYSADLVSIPLTSLSETSDLLGGFEQHSNGGFFWRNGALLDALEKGHWIFFENASACPSSVLDRLNGLFEPERCLFVHEKSGFDSPIQAHPKFRAFMASNSGSTGSISRPMRNRALEIFVENMPFSLIDTLRFLYPIERKRFATDLEFLSFAHWMYDQISLCGSVDGLINGSEFVSHLLFNLRKIEYFGLPSFEMMTNFKLSSLLVLKSLSFTDADQNISLLIQNLFLNAIDELFPLEICSGLILFFKSFALALDMQIRHPSEKDLFIQLISLLSTSTLLPVPIRKDFPLWNLDKLESISSRLIISKDVLKTFPSLKGFFNFILSTESNEKTEYFSLWKAWFSDLLPLVRNGMRFNKDAFPNHLNIFNNNDAYTRQRLAFSAKSYLSFHSNSRDRYNFLDSVTDSDIKSSLKIEELITRFFVTTALHAIVTKNGLILDMILNIGILPFHIACNIQYLLWAWTPSSPLYSAFHSSWVSFLIQAILGVFNYLSGKISPSLLDLVYDICSLLSYNMPSTLVQSNSMVTISDLVRVKPLLNQFVVFISSTDFTTLTKNSCVDSSPLLYEILKIDPCSPIKLTLSLSLLFENITFPNFDPVLFSLFPPVFKQQSTVNESNYRVLHRTFELLCGSSNNPMAFDNDIDLLLDQTNQLTEVKSNLMEYYLPNIFNVVDSHLPSLYSQFNIFKSDFISACSLLAEHNLSNVTTSIPRKLNSVLLSLLNQLSYSSSVVPFDILGPIFLPLVLLLLHLRFNPDRKVGANNISTVGFIPSSILSITASSKSNLHAFFIDWVNSFDMPLEKDLNILGFFIYGFGLHQDKNVPQLSTVSLPKSIIVLETMYSSLFTDSQDSILNLVYKVSDLVSPFKIEFDRLFINQECGDPILFDFNLSLVDIYSFRLDFFSLDNASLNCQLECIVSLCSRIMTCIEKGYDVLRMVSSIKMKEFLAPKLESLAHLLISLRKFEIRLTTKILCVENICHYNSTSLLTMSIGLFISIFRESLKPEINFKILFDLIDSFFLNTSIIEAKMRISLLSSLYNFHKNYSKNISPELLNLLYHVSAYFDKCFFSKISGYISNESATLNRELKEKSVLITCSYLNEIIIKQSSDKIHHLCSRIMKKWDETLSTPTTVIISSSCSSLNRKVETITRSISYQISTEGSFSLLLKASTLFFNEMIKYNAQPLLSFTSESILSSLFEICCTSSNTQPSAFGRSQKTKFFSEYLKSCRDLGLFSLPPNDLSFGIHSPLIGSFLDSFLGFPMLSSSFLSYVPRRSFSSSNSQQISMMISSIEVNFVEIFKCVPNFNKFVVSIPGISQSDQTAKIHKQLGNLFTWFCIYAQFAESNVSRFHLLALKFDSICVSFKTSNFVILPEFDYLCDILSLLDLISKSIHSDDRKDNFTDISSIKSEFTGSHHCSLHLNPEILVSIDCMSKYSSLFERLGKSLSQFPFAIFQSVNIKALPLHTLDGNSSCDLVQKNILLLVQHFIRVNESLSSCYDNGSSIPNFFVYFNLLFSDTFYNALNELSSCITNDSEYLLKILVEMIDSLTGIFLTQLYSISSLCVNSLATLTSLYENNFGELSTKSQNTSSDRIESADGSAMENSSENKDSLESDVKGLADASPSSSMSKNVSNEIEYEEQISDTIKQDQNEKESTEPENSSTQDHSQKGDAVTTSESLEGMSDVKNDSLESEFQSGQEDPLSDNPHTKQCVSEHKFNEEETVGGDIDQSDPNDLNDGNFNDMMDKLSNDVFKDQIEKSIWESDISNDLSEIEGDENISSIDAELCDSYSNTQQLNTNKNSTSENNFPQKISSTSPTAEMDEQFQNTTTSDLENTFETDHEFDEMSQCFPDNVDHLSEDDDNISISSLDHKSTCSDIENSVEKDSVGSSQAQEPFNDYETNESMQLVEDQLSSNEETSPLESLGTSSFGSEIQNPSTENQLPSVTASQSESEAITNSTSNSIIENLLKTVNRNSIDPCTRPTNVERELGDQLSEWKKRLTELLTQPPDSMSKEFPNNSQSFEYDLENSENFEQVLSSVTKKELSLLKNNMHANSTSSSLNETELRSTEQNLDSDSPMDNPRFDDENEPEFTSLENCVIGDSNSTLMSENTASYENIKALEGYHSPFLNLDSPYSNEAVSNEKHNWSEYLQLTHGLACELTEKLRMILEPTISGKLQGDYKTGKRLNMKKIIPYIASGYRKDKIWLRRTKPSKRNYQILISVDQSLSMASSGAPRLVFQVLALLSQVFSKIEAGHIGLAGFGSSTYCYIPLPGCKSDVDLHFNMDFDEQIGEKIIKKFHFTSESTNLISLLSKSLEWFKEAKHSSTSIASQLHFILSDGIFNDTEHIRRLLQKFTSDNVLVVFLLLDPHSTKDSILELKSVSYEFDKLKPIMKISRYIDQFPADQYIVVRDVTTLPDVFCQVLREWIEGIKRTAESDTFLT